MNIFANLYKTICNQLKGKVVSKTEALSIQQTKDMLQERIQHYNALFWSKTKLQYMRTQRLQALLRYAKKHSPWYQKQLSKINIENFTEERLCEIPTINKETLMENWDEIVTVPRLSLSIVEKHLARKNVEGDLLYFLDRYHVLSSSASSGKRGVFIYDWDEWNQYYSFATRYGFLNSKLNPIPEPTKKPRVAQIVVMNTVYLMYALSKTFKNENLEKYYFPITLPTDQIVAGLNEVQADVLIGTPSTVYKLCREAELGRLVIQPQKILLGGEPLYFPIRQLINKIWPQSLVFNMLGSSEGVIGRNCRANSREMHLNDDACILQPVDKKGNIVEKEVIPAQMLLTNLYNYTLPLIRYEFTDQLVFLDKTCDCGVAHQLIAEPQGRPEFDFIYPNNIFVHHLVFVTTLLLEKNIREYQVIQTKNGADIKIHSIGDIDKLRVKNYIEKQLSDLGLNQPNINFIEVQKFDYPASGKLRRFLKLSQSQR